MSNSFQPEELWEAHFDQDCECTVHDSTVDMFSNPVLGRRVQSGGIKFNSLSTKIVGEVLAKILATIIIADLLQCDTVDILDISLVSLEVLKLIHFGLGKFYDCPP